MCSILHRRQQYRLGSLFPGLDFGVFFGAFHMVDLFVTLGGILLVGIVAKVGMGLVFGWQTERESVMTGRQRTE
jgi:hypothetical protein